MIRNYTAAQDITSVYSVWHDIGAYAEAECSDDRLIILSQMDWRVVNRIYISSDRRLERVIGCDYLTFLRKAYKRSYRSALQPR